MSQALEAWGLSHQAAREVLATSFVNILGCKMSVIYDFLRFFLLFLKQRTFREFGPFFVLTYCSCLMTDNVFKGILSSL